jgi:hypothetical protein
MGCASGPSYIYIYIQGVFNELDAFTAPRLHRDRPTAGRGAHANFADDSSMLITFGMKGSSYFFIVENAVPLHVDIPRTGGKTFLFTF